jgi:hypothetical protein
MKEKQSYYLHLAMQVKMILYKINNFEFSTIFSINNIEITPYYINTMDSSLKFASSSKKYAAMVN